MNLDVTRTHTAVGLNKNTPINWIILVSGYLQRRQFGINKWVSKTELRSARHGYYAMISELDHHIGRILDNLEKLSLTENTIVVFTSDHGEWLGEHLRYGKGYLGHDCVSRVPLIIRYPRKIAKGKNVTQIVEGIDVVPSLLDYSGIPIPQHLQGPPLTKVIQNDDNKQNSIALTEMEGWKTIRIE